MREMNVAKKDQYLAGAMSLDDERDERFERQSFLSLVGDVGRVSGVWKGVRKWEVGVVDSCCA